MIRAFVSVLAFTFASAAFASETCENLVLNCSAMYQAFDGTVESAEAPTAFFADENPYEPSLSNCAATLYFPEVDGDFKTIVGVRATKDQNGLFTVTAGAGQLKDTPEGRLSARTEWNPTYGTIEVAHNKGSISVKNPFKVFNESGKTIYLGCRVSKVN
jgi:hypothetical protein